VRDSWPSVSITALDVDAEPGDTGTMRSVSVRVALDGLQPQDIRVEVVHGTVGTDGEFKQHPAVVVLEPSGDGSTYHGEISLQAPGSYGVTARIIPVHPELASPHDLGLATWAG
jgi:starch phosphorylase